MLGGLEERALLSLRRGGGEQRGRGGGGYCFVFKAIPGHWAIKKRPNFFACGAPKKLSLQVECRSVPITVTSAGIKTKGLSWVRPLLQHPLCCKALNLLSSLTIHIQKAI